MQEYIIGKVRIQILSKEIVRIEYSDDRKFCDRDTFIIPDRSSFTGFEGVVNDGEKIVSGDYIFFVGKDAKSLEDVWAEKDGQRVYIGKNFKNTGELPPLNQTPEIFAVSDNPHIFVPKEGYCSKRSSEYETEENVQDVYLLLCGKDAKKLRRLFVELTGKCELVRLSAFGGWNSKYFAYDENSAKQLIYDYELHNVPLDNMVIDTDWRAAAERGTGYEINTDLFPDMKRFLSFAHEHNVEVMFNDHPEPKRGTTSIFDGEEIEYREGNLQSLMALGLDTWWYDRNWHTKLLSPSRSVGCETLGMYVFSEITKHFYQKQSGDRKVYRRPQIMGNVDDISNGFYLGIKSSASHRYSIQWTGDSMSDSDSIAQEVRNLILGGNNCIAYINADCGGHVGNPDKECFIRWMQFGTLSPVFRPHGSKAVERFREPWVFDEETLDIVREYNNMRYRLLPVIYKNAYMNYKTGEPIFRGLGWEYPSDETATTYEREYMLGNDILIAPIAGTVLKPIKKENYKTSVKAVFYNGRKLEGDPIAVAVYDRLFMACNHTSPEKNVPVYEYSAHFETILLFHEETEIFIRTDDGATVWIDGEIVLRDETLHGAKYFSLGMIKPDIPHKVDIDYFQASGEAACMLMYKDPKEQQRLNEIYLPQGKWIDVFDGSIYGGENYVRKNYSLRRMPLFVRSGALIPLAYDARNTKEQKWDKMIFDYYPDKESSDFGFIYEDDGETTAYKSGAYKITRYKAEYDKREGAYRIIIDVSEGCFTGKRAVKQRSILLKIHVRNTNKIGNITLNGQNILYKKSDIDLSVFPFSTETAAADSPIVTAEFDIDSEREYEIRIFDENRVSKEV